MLQPIAILPLPLWLSALLLFLDFVLPAALLLLGLFLARRFWKQLGPTRTLLCIKCDYDMRASLTLTCPDCGHTHKNKAQLQVVSLWPKVRFGLSLILLIPGLWLLFFCAWYFPKTHFANAQARALVSRLQPLPIQTSNNSDYAVPADIPIWTLRLARLGWAAGGAKLVFPYQGGMIFPSLRVPRIYTGDPGVPLFHTLCSWTWYPSLNYIWYMPDETCATIAVGQPIDLAAPPSQQKSPIPQGPFTLTLDQARAITQMPHLQSAYLGPQVIVDDQSLAQFAQMTSSPSDFIIERYLPNPAQAATWDTLLHLDGITRLHIDPSSPPPPSFFKVLARSPNIQCLVIIPIPVTSGTPASPQPSSATGVTFADGLKLLSSRTFSIVEFDAGTTLDRTQAYRTFTHPSGLEILSLKGIDIHPDEIDALTNLKDLSSLTLSFAPAPASQSPESQIQDTLAGVDDASFAILLNSARLQAITLTSPHLSPAQEAQIKSNQLSQPAGKIITIR